MIVGPCLVVTGGDEPRVIENGAVRVVGAHIAQMGEAGTLASSYPDETVWPARGRVLLPGLVNTHAHLARHLARGLDLATRGDWDRYDRALTPDAVHASVMAALLEGVRHGVTTVCDFHRSGGCLDLSLVEVAGAALKVGVRLATCYGATDDDPEDERRASLEESLGLAADLKRRREGRLRGTVGVRAHALSTIERLLEESLAAAGGLAVHVDLDLDVTVAERWNGTLPRGHTPSLWAHAERAPRRLAGLAAERGDSLATTGAASLTVMREAAWGSDAGANAPPLPPGPHGASVTGAAPYHKLFVAGARWASTHFGEGLGAIEPGAPADLILVDYRPATELSRRTLDAHLAAGLLRSPVSGVMVGGEILLDNGTFVTLDENRVAAQARECARRVWSRM